MVSRAELQKRAADLFIAREQAQIALLGATLFRALEIGRQVKRPGDDVMDAKAIPVTIAIGH